ncbi:MAG: type III-B CRISPR-associated protein Cas10/Cmr2 [Gammaproteobacteria bacterium]|nr:type III-B CRISPR-associated protein Cas10/Cmr2 [Gammaproteobacteria bacterium]
MSDLWKTKLKARLHEPFTEPLTKVLKLDGANEDAIDYAEKWAVAADRPQWLKAPWTELNWNEEPHLLHPLSGDELDLSELGFASCDEKSVTNAVVEHVKKLTKGVDGDAHKSHLALWRFSSDLFSVEDPAAQKLAALWRMTPSDGRVPDHSVADHSDLTSAFAGAFNQDSEGGAALLALAIGPVQSFIAAARSTSDLWAGSHLLARLSWETMKPVVKALGPDAILFPRLRGVPLVDLWLRDECDLPAEWFESCDWQQESNDSNPLFSAALPNRFVAVVPADQAKALAEECETHVRQWLQDKGKKVVDRLLKEVDERQDESLYCYQQMREQLAGFPEVHWSAVPFSLIKVQDKARQTDLDTKPLQTSMAPLFGVAENEESGFLDTEVWQTLKKEMVWKDGSSFIVPTPGVLYPAVFDLAERVLASAKSLRQFDQLEQKGWRCSLSGEGEWLTTDKTQLKKSYRQQENTLWAKIAKERPAWAKKGEHLAALPALKRLWPTLFAEEVGRVLRRKTVDRYVVSTHSMALVHQLDRWLELPGLPPTAFQRACEEHGPATGIALPKRLVERHRSGGKLKQAKQLLGLLELASESDEANTAEEIRTVVADTLGEALDSGVRQETYYSLLLMDGDRMGKILSGDEQHSMTYAESFHRSMKEGFNAEVKKNQSLKKYAEQKRAVSPSRHMAISGALNDFSQKIVRYVVEEEHLGKLIYAGGDDVLAMLPVADLLPAADRLRQAYSGIAEGEQTEDSQLKGLILDSGFALLDGVLYRTMGSTATVSAGLVVVHHQAPLQQAMTVLHSAETAAKKAGRNCFHLKIIKRSGNLLQLTLPWGAVTQASYALHPLKLLLRLCAYLRDEAVSRRAVFHSLAWMKDLPEPQGDAEMLATLLAYQLKRQAGDKKSVSDYHNLDGLAQDLARLAACYNDIAAQTKKLVGIKPEARKEKKKRTLGLAYLANFMAVAEFLAREGRGKDDANRGAEA